MLILSRRINESINIGDDVIVRVLSVKGEHVRIGIDAPFDVCVHREEIYLQIQQDKAIATDGKNENVAEPA